LKLNPQDIRTDYYRDGSVYWRGRGKMFHLPTGISVEFCISWDDQSGLEQARGELERRIFASEHTT
jgi:hypothetical protein